jgi:O-antigen ligase
MLPFAKAKVHFDAPTFLVQVILYALVLCYLFPTFYSGGFFQNTNVVSADPNYIAQAVFIVLLVATVVPAGLSRLGAKELFWGFLPFVPFVAWAFLSVAWSFFPDLTLRRSFRLAVEITTIVLLSLLLRKKQRIMRTCFRIFLLATFVDFGSLALPAISFDALGQFIGLQINKNLTGEFFALAIPIFALGLIDRTISKSFLAAASGLVMAGTMLALTDSKTPIVVFVAGTALAGVTYFLMFQRKHRAAFLCIFLLFLVAIGLLVLYIGYSETIMFLFNDTTFTGRLHIWGYTLYRAAPVPLQGVGYGALWQVGNDTELSLRRYGIDFVINEAHNGYLDILAQLGYVGVFCLCSFLVIGFYRIIRFVARETASKSVALYSLYVLYGAMTYNLAESSFFRPGDSFWMTLILFVTYGLNDTNKYHHVGRAASVLRKSAQLGSRQVAA